MTGIEVSLFQWLDHVAWTLTLPLVFLFICIGLDDSFVDLFSLIKKIRPTPLTPERWAHLSAAPQKRLAIMIASWQEAGVLKPMIQGNLGQLLYQNHDFFLGVYPNDAETLKEARMLEKAHSRVHVIVNAQPGPTSKGQMINEIARGIFSFEEHHRVSFQALILHDSEDLIHPKSLCIINDALDHHDFIQIPVFSLPLRVSHFTGGTYIDEFDEIHTKDLLVRNYLGEPIPSAGVGTALSRALVKKILNAQSGNLLNCASLTEDYELGLSSHRLGCRYKFACYTDVSDNSTPIATREYFPLRLRQAIRQKSRWVTGIVFQGTKNLGWQGSSLHKYFLLRDRKGPVSNISALFGFILCTYLSLRFIVAPQDVVPIETLFPSLTFLPLFIYYGAILNSLFMCSRLFQRMVCTYRVHGSTSALISPMRAPVSIIINACASIKAAYQYAMSITQGKAIRWAKTEHVLPAGFGNPAEVKPS